MSPLPAGNYRLRWIPPYTHFPFVGGVYATGEAVKESILAKPLHSPGEQIWGINPVDGKDNIYNITFPTHKFPGGGHGPVIPGWSLPVWISPITPLVVDFNIVEWNIVKIDAENNVYRIAEANEPLRAVIVQENQLFAKPDAVSQWQLIPDNS